MTSAFHRMLNAALLLSCVGAATYWSLQLSSGRETPKQLVPPPSPAPVARSVPVDARPLAALFGTNARPGTETIRLVGIVASGGGGIAALHIGSGPPQLIRVGDRLDDGRIVASVEPTQVTLEGPKGREFLVLAPPPPAPGIETRPARP